MKVTIAYLIFLASFASFSQNTNNLKKILWDRVQDCYSLFETDEDGALTYDKIDDADNGYLSVWGSFPTCGCTCSSTIGAYKDNNGIYTFLQKDEFLCEYKKLLSSNKDLDKILPENFGIQTFSKEGLNINSMYAVFFLDSKIPRVGTETEFNLKLIPFGIFQELNNAVISYGYSQDNENVSVHYIKEIEYMVRTIVDDSTLNYLLKKDYKNIHIEDRKFIERALIGPYSMGYFDSFEELSEKLSILKNAHKIYSQLEFLSVIMQWNKQKARFEVKSKSNGPKAMTFKEFIMENEFWVPIC